MLSTIFYYPDANFILSLALLGTVMYFSKLFPKNVLLTKRLNLSSAYLIFTMFADAIVSYLSVKSNYFDFSTRVFGTMLKIFSSASLMLYAATWTTFIYTYENKAKKLSFSSTFRIKTLVYIICILLLATPYNGLIFSTGTSGNLIIPGMLYSLPQIVTLIYLGVSIIYLIRIHKKISKNIFILFFTITIVSFVSILLEAIARPIFSYISATSVLTILLYVSLLDQIERYDANTNAWSRQTFDSFLDAKNFDGIDISFVYITLDNYERLKRESDYKLDVLQDLLIKEFSNICLSVLDKKDDFIFLENNEFGILYTQNDEYVKASLKKIKDKIDEFNSREDKTISIEYTYGISNNISKGPTYLVKDAYIKMYDNIIKKKDIEEKELEND